MALTGKLTKKLVENLGAGRHGDGGGLYLVVEATQKLYTLMRAPRALDARIFHVAWEAEITSPSPSHPRRPFPGSPCSW